MPSCNGATHQRELLLEGGRFFGTMEGERQIEKAPIKKLARHVLSEPLFGANFRLFDLKGEVAVLYDNEEDEPKDSLDAHSLSYMDGWGDTPEEWTDNGLAQLFGNLLDQSMMALNCKGNAKQKEEVLQWIYAPSLYLDSRGNVVQARDIPSTFQFCCRLARENPETYWDFIEKFVEADLRGEIHERYAKVDTEARIRAQNRAINAQVRAQAKASVIAEKMAFVEDVAAALAISLQAPSCN